MRGSVREPNYFVLMILVSYKEKRPGNVTPFGLWSWLTSGHPAALSGGDLRGSQERGIASKLSCRMVGFPSGLAVKIRLPMQGA